MTVYHYTHFGEWRGINKGTRQNNHEPGLVPLSPLGTTFGPIPKGVKATFALLEPLPENWTANPDFKDVWDYLRPDIGELLLEVDVDLENDNGVFVLDRGHMEGFLYQDRSHTPLRYLHDAEFEAQKAYWESKVPLKDYLARRDEVNFSLPEVIITESIPLERVRVSEQQPLLDQILREGKPPDQKEILHELARTQELRPWENRNVYLVEYLRAVLGIKYDSKETYY